MRARERKRLAEVLATSSTDKMLIAIAGFKQMQSPDTPIDFWHRYWGTRWKKLKSYFKCDKYYNAFVSRTPVFTEVNLDTIRKIWADRDVVFVVGQGSRFVMDSRLFDNIKSHKFIYVQPQNAYDEYDKVLHSCAKCKKNTLFFRVF